VPTAIVFFVKRLFILLDRDASTAIVAGAFMWSVISHILYIVSFIFVVMHDHFANTTLIMI
jgi:hypothetical protein